MFLRLSSDMDMNNGIPFFGLNVEFNSVHPIDSNRIVSYFNQFSVTTVQLLNRFALTCDSRLRKLDLKLQNVEATLDILEAKLSSVPGLTTNIPTPASVPVVVSPTPPVEVEQIPTIEVAPRSAPALLPAEDDLSNSVDSSRSEDKDAQPDPRVEPFLKMIRFGVPAMAVQLKMRAENLDPDLINYVIKLHVTLHVEIKFSSDISVKGPENFIFQKRREDKHGR